MLEETVILCFVSVFNGSFEVIIWQCIPQEENVQNMNVDANIVVNGNMMNVFTVISPIFYNHYLSLLLHRRSYRRSYRRKRKVEERGNRRKRKVEERGNRRKRKLGFLGLLGI